MAYLKEGLAPTGDVVDATEEYQRSQDKIGMFLAESGYAVDPEKRIQLVVLFQAYNEWRMEQGFKSVGRSSFKEEVLAKGYQVRPSTGHVDWVYGIGPRALAALPPLGGNAAVVSLVK